MKNNPRAVLRHGAQLESGSEAVRDVILLDTSAVFYLVEGHGSRKSVVAGFIEAARAGRIGLCVSSILWLEVLAAARGSTEQEYRRFLADSRLVVTHIVDVAVAEEAGRLRRLHGLGLADAVHIATARLWKADGILGNDSAWRSCPECPPVHLVDELASLDAQTFESWFTDARMSFG